MKFSLKRALIAVGVYVVFSAILYVIGVYVDDKFERDLNELYDELQNKEA